MGIADLFICQEVFLRYRTKIIGNIFTTLRNKFLKLVAFLTFMWYNNNVTR